MDSFNDWQNHNALRLSAALAYYSIFSIAPLLVLSVGLAGMFFGADAVSGELYRQLREFVGPQASAAIQSMVQSTSHPAKSMLATVTGTVVLLFGAAGVFGQLKDALNTIWEVKTAPGLNWWAIVRERLLSFGMVLVIGFLLLVSFVLTATVAAFQNLIGSFLQMPGWLWGGAGLAASFLVVTILFALIFKVLPDVTNRWKHVWVGAAATALLFEVGKFGLAYYLGRESTASSFGAAGSVVLLLLWVYYASCILLFGAEFTKMYALTSGDPIRAEGLAVPESATSVVAGAAVPREPRVPEPHRESLPVIFAAPAKAEAADHPDSDSPMEYVREHMAVGMLGAVGCGLAVGLASRLVPHPSESQDPGTQLRTGLHMLGAASLLLLTRGGREAANRIGGGLRRLVRN